MMTPRFMKTLLLAAGLLLPVTATGAAAAHPVEDGHRGHAAAEAYKHKKAARRHARREARRHARAHARAARAARHRYAYRHDGYGYPRFAYRLAYPWARYWGRYGYGTPRYRYDDDCNGY
ncbi:MAG: hypothetical protein D6807_04495 [Alphaproteobacteria bacterium]|nr:MAG: hypothetical protein D6807_04495 [Alphaproteobacteria bacterium]